MKWGVLRESGRSTRSRTATGPHGNGPCRLASGKTPHSKGSQARRFISVSAYASFRNSGRYQFFFTSPMRVQDADFIRDRTLEVVHALGQTRTLRLPYRDEVRSEVHFCATFFGISVIVDVLSYSRESWDRSISKDDRTRSLDNRTCWEAGKIQIFSEWIVTDHFVCWCEKSRGVIAVYREN